MGVVYTTYLAIFGRESVCSHQTIDRVSLLQQQQEGRGRRTTPLIVVTSVFAQLDSKSEELLKRGVKLFWVQEELAILTVSFHIGYVYHYCSIVYVHVTVSNVLSAYSSLKIISVEHFTHFHTVPCIPLCLSSSLYSFSDFIPLRDWRNTPQKQCKEKNC